MPRSLPASARRAFAGWRVLAALSFVFVVNMGFSQFGGAVLNAYTALGLHLDRRTLGHAALAAAVVYGLVAPLAAVLVFRIGARATIVLGSVLMALGAALNGTVVTAAWQFVLVAGGLLGLGIGLSTQLSAQACTTAWFARRRALAVSLVWTAAGVGGYFAPPLLTRSVLHGSWRSGWLLLAATLAASALVAGLFITNKPSDLGQFPDGRLPDSLDRAAGSTALPSAVLAGASDSPPVPARSRRTVFRSQLDWTLTQAVARVPFWAILVGALAQTAAIYVYLAHGVLHLMDLGHSSHDAAYSVSIFAIGAVVGKLAAGGLGDYVEPRFVWSVGSVLMAYGMFGLVDARSNFAMYVPSLALGIGNGVSLVCWSTLLANYFGPRAFPALMGAQVPVVSVLGALAPLAAGSVFELRHTYAPVFYPLAGFSFAAAAMLLFASPPRVFAEREAVPPCLSSELPVSAFANAAREGKHSAR